MMTREQLADAFDQLVVRYGFAPEGGPPNLRGYDQHIELNAHELAHAIDLGISWEGGSSPEASEEIWACLRLLSPTKRNEREFRALAIEVLGLHSLGYRVRLATLARSVELAQPSGLKSITNLVLERNPPRTVKYIEKQVRQYMEQDDVKVLVSVFVRVVEAAHVEVKSS